MVKRRPGPKSTHTNGKKPAKGGRARTGTKQSQLIGLLKRKNGATISEISTAVGWQPHSVRGAISGTLKKTLGLTVTSAEVDRRGRVYRIVDAA